MALKNLHIRVSNEEYDFLCALAEELHCSQAAVIRKALFHSDMKAIVQVYRKRQGDAYLQRIVACGLDDSAAEKLEGLQKDMNENTLQIRRIGTNLSTLIRDIRNGKLQLQNDEVILSRLVDTFISRISLTMLPVPNPHNTACVLSWEEARHWQSRSSDYSSS